MSNQRFHQVYGYAMPGRYGLGNMLLPWARCFLWCRDNQAPMIAPRWTYLRLGPYLRRERDKRNYQRFFRQDGYISGLRRALLLVSTRRLTEEQAAEVAGEGTRVVVCFEGMGDFFRPLAGRHAEVRAELRRITRPELLNQPPASLDGRRTSVIGVHVRRGDFAPSDMTALASGLPNYRIPLAWYIETLQRLRVALGWEAKTFIFSDGAEEELAPLLDLPNVDLYRTGSAIGDLFALAASQVMIASGSTFSMWASFLGQVPCLWFPGQRQQRLLHDDPSGCLEPEVGLGDAIPAELVEYARHRWEAA